MPELFYGSQYSSGWKPISRSDSESEQTNSRVDERLKRLVVEFDKMKSEYDEKINNALNEARLNQIKLNIRIQELTDVLNEKDNEIKRLTEENKRIIDDNRMLNEKCKYLFEQLLDSNNKDKGFIESLIKKIVNKKSHQNEHMHSID